jgi:uncharacterized protein YeaO (DUF488 family)
MKIELKQAYQFIKEEKPEEAYAVLVDRLWPRGIRKAELALDEWAKHLAPSDALRRWYAHQPERWPEFRRRYRNELRPFAGELEQLRRLAERQPLILLYGAHDSEHNQAVVLRELLLQPPKGES